MSELANGYQRIEDCTMFLHGSNGGNQLDPEFQSKPQWRCTIKLRATGIQPRPFLLEKLFLRGAVFC